MAIYRVSQKVWNVSKLKKVQPLSLAYLNTLNIKMIYVKNLFQGIASIIFWKQYVSGNVKYGVTK